MIAISHSNLGFKKARYKRGKPGGRQTGRYLLERKVREEKGKEALSWRGEEGERINKGREGVIRRSWSERKRK